MTTNDPGSGRVISRSVYGWVEPRSGTKEERLVYYRRPLVNLGWQSRMLQIYYIGIEHCGAPKESKDNNGRWLISDVQCAAFTIDCYSPSTICD